MTKIQFENGKIVDFQGNPTPQDIDHVAQQMNINTPKSEFKNMDEANAGQKKANLDFRRAKINASPMNVFAQGLSDTKKDLPFGNPEMPLSPRNILGETGKAASLLPGMGPALSGATYMTGQSLEDKDKPLTTAGKAIAGAAGGKALDFLSKGISSIPKGIEYSSGRLVNSLIKPLLKDFSYGKNPGAQVAKEGITANNLDELASKIDQRRKEVGNQISVITNHPTVAKKIADYSDVTKPIDDALLEAQKNPRTNSGLIKRLEDTKKDMLGIKEDQWGNIISQKDLTKLTPAEAAGIKTDIGNMTKWTGNQSDDQEVNKALKQTYGKLKERINTKVPQLKELNERYANLTSAKVATQYRDKILQRQNLTGMGVKVAGYGGVLAGIASHNPALIAASIAELGADKILGSPALKTRVASGLAKISKADAIKVLSKFPNLGKAFPLIMSVNSSKKSKNIDDNAQ